MGPSPTHIRCASQLADKTPAGGLHNTPHFTLDPVIYKFHYTPKPTHPQRTKQLTEKQTVTVQSGLTEDPLHREQYQQLVQERIPESQKPTSRLEQEAKILHKQYEEEMDSCQSKNIFKNQKNNMTTPESSRSTT